MTRADTVGIVGAGAFGTALANLVAGAGRDVLLWSRNRDVVAEIGEDHHNDARLPGVELSPRLKATSDVGELAQSARFIVVAVASTQVRERARLLGDVLDGRHLLVHAIGALADPGDVRVSEVLREETPVLRIGVLAGPALSRDLVEGQYASMVCASAFDEVTAEARRLLGVPPVLRLYRGRDVVGVELAAALSGAYTVALGLADVLRVSPGPRAVLITRAVAEASRVGRAAGAEPRTFSGLAGLGNLLVRSAAAAGERSRDYRVGAKIASDGDGARPRPTEGVRAAVAGARLAGRLGVHAPVLTALAAVVQGKLSPMEAAAAAADTVALEE